MKTKLALAISSILALSACDDYKLASEADNIHSIGTVAISGDPTTGETLSADITDADGFAEDGVVYSWMRDGVVVDRAGSTYALSDADLDTSISVQVSYTDNAGYSEIAISAATDAVEIPSVLSAGSVAIDGSALVGIELKAVITDDNGFGANEIFYTWMADGVVIDDAENSKYKLTTNEIGKTITVSVAYIDNDDYEEETTSDPTVAVTEPEEEIVTTQVAKISDTDPDDTGELRFKLSDVGIDDPIIKGKLSVRFRKEEGALNTNDDKDIKDAYIGIFGSKISTGYELAELRIQQGAKDSDGVYQDGQYVMRGDAVSISESFTGDDWVDVDITWDATGASATNPPNITLSINDGPVYAFPVYTSGKKDDGDLTHWEHIMGGLESVVFKIGDDAATIPTSLFIDDVKLYDDNATDPTVPVFADSFEASDVEEPEEPGYGEGYAVDDLLHSGNANSPYNSSTSEAVVALETLSSDEEEPVIEGDDNLQAVKITDTLGIGDATTDTGELRYKLDSSELIESGKLTVSFLKEQYTKNDNTSDFNDDGSLDESNKDAYIGIFGTKVGTGYELMELRIQESAYVIRGQEGTVDVAESLIHDEWVDVEITWDASSATASVPPVITVSIDGTPVSTDAFAVYNSEKSDPTDGTHWESIKDGVQYVVFKLGDNDATVNKAFYIDDVVLSSDAVTDPIFEDDFEGYPLNTDLDSGNDSNVQASPYSDSSSEAVVVDRP